MQSPRNLVLKPNPLQSQERLYHPLMLLLFLCILPFHCLLLHLCPCAPLVLKQSSPLSGVLSIFQLPLWTLQLRKKLARIGLSSRLPSLISKHCYVAGFAICGGFHNTLILGVLQGILHMASDTNSVHSPLLVNLHSVPA